MRNKDLFKARDLARVGILSAPANFRNATDERLIEVCNGCGAEDSWFRPSEKIQGTNIVYACIIHDWMYHFGHVIEDKDSADRTMLNNMNRLIARAPKKWYRPNKLKYATALVYYSTVVWFGGAAFWKGKDDM